MIPLYARVVPVQSLNWAEKERMYLLMRSYYDSTPREEFLKDLEEKNAVIILRDKKENLVRGFSTLLQVRFKVRNRTIRGIFSGDTLIEKEFWGQTALGKAFLKYLWLQHLRNPFQPLYWFLISKGYKTYLMMANNFKEHFPRYEEETPAFHREIMQEFYGQRFPGLFKSSSGLIEPKTVQACRLKSGVAETDPELCSQFPRIRFFQETNPKWKSGTELACIAKMTLLMPLQYVLKKKIRSLLGRTKIGSDRSIQGEDTRTIANGTDHRVLVRVR